MLYDKYNLTLPRQTCEDCLLVSFNYCPPDVATLVIFRENSDSTVTKKTIYGDKALKIYKELTSQ